MSGLTAFANVRISGAMGTVCISTTAGCSCNASGGTYVASGLINNGQYLCVKNVAASAASTFSKSTVTVGSYTTKFMNYTGQLFQLLFGCGRRRRLSRDHRLTHPLASPDGLTGTAVTSGAVGHNPPRNTWALIRQYLNSSCGMNLAP